MAGETVAVAGTLEGFFAFHLAFEHITGVTGFAFLNFHSFCVRNLLAVITLGMVTFATFQSFLMLGMGEFYRFFPVRVDRHLSRTFVHISNSHTDQAKAAEKGQCHATDYNSFHVFLLNRKNKFDYRKDLFRTGVPVSVAGKTLSGMAKSDKQIFLSLKERR